MELVQRSAGGAICDARNSGSSRFRREQSGTYSNSAIGGFLRDIEVKPGALVEFSVDVDGLVAGSVLKVNDRQVKVDPVHPVTRTNPGFEVEVLAVLERRG